MRSRVPLAEFRDAAVARWRARWRPPGPARGHDGRLRRGLRSGGTRHWIRRQAWTPPAGLDYFSGHEWFEQCHERPLVWRGRVYATQPGVWGVECLELESGRLLWRQGDGDLTRLAGMAGGRLILSTSWGPAVLDAESGKLLWTREVKDCLATWTCGPDDAILSVSMHLGPRGIARTRPASSSPGSMRRGPAGGHAVIELPVQGGWYLGPPAAAGTRQWLAMAPGNSPRGGKSSRRSASATRRHLEMEDASPQSCDPVFLRVPPYPPW